jgi:hypothetical protein
MLESPAYRQSGDKLKEKLKEKYPNEPGLVCDKIADQCLREYLSDKCKSCHGAKEMIVGTRRITCEVCSGFGIRRWSDFERARCTGLAVGRVKTLERKFRWAIDLLLSLDSEVNRQIEFYLGRGE